MSGNIFQECIKITRSLQSDEVVMPANMSVTNKYLRNSPSSRHFHHFRPAIGLILYIDFFDISAFRDQQLLRSNTKRTPIRSVHSDLSGQRICILNQLDSPYSL